MTEEWSSTNQEKSEPFPATPAHSDEPSSRGVPVPSDVPAEGTSEAAEPVDGVKVDAIAQQGLADGETDVRMPRTTTF